MMVTAIRNHTGNYKNKNCFGPKPVPLLPEAAHRWPRPNHRIGHFALRHYDSGGPFADAPVDGAHHCPCCCWLLSSAIQIKLVQQTNSQEFSDFSFKLLGKAAKHAAQQAPGEQAKPCEQTAQGDERNQGQWNSAIFFNALGNSPENPRTR
jgi:hypothetical protein